MIDHLGLQCVDVEAAAAFYLRVFAPCGIREAMRYDTPEGPVFELVTAAGAEVLHEPRVWPEYHPGYYGVFFRDPDGNNVEAVHHTPPS
jgi:catechol 2,3-dioxygenase-like lactoylglutathione lyase family enzyme